MKKIKSSKRGLTFSCDANEHFQPGSRYSYFVADHQIIIKANESGSMKVSKKKVGKKIKSLFDLRNKNVLNKLQSADFLEISFDGDQIIVSLCKKSKVSILQKKQYAIDDALKSKQIATYCIPTTLLSSAVGFNNYQYTFDDYFPQFISNELEQRTVKKNVEDIFKVISLFSGPGMLDYPFELDDKFEIIFACDKSEAAVKSHRHNIHSPVVCRDIRSISNVGSADVVIGGPSCRAFSNENHKARLLDHPDYRLVDEYIRIVKESNPKVFVIENVPDFVTANEGELLNAVLEELNGYKSTVNMVIDADVGGYTSRKRAFIIGSKIGSIQLPDLKILPRKTVKEALSKVDNTWFNYGDISKNKPETIEKMKYVPDGGNWENIPPELQDKGTHSNHYRRLDPDGIAPAMVNIRKVCMMPPLSSPNPNRILSVAEALALSGFDKNFHVQGNLNEKQQQVGDGVPFAMGVLIKDTIKRALLKSSPLLA